MSEFVPTLTTALLAHMRQLCHLRECSEVDAWTVICRTAAENLRDCKGKDDQLYWRAALEIAERHLVAAEDPRWPR